MSPEYTIRPTKNRLVVRPITEDMVTQSGIILPEVAERRPTRGEVISVGEDVTEFAPGQYVLYPRYAGVETEVDGETYIVLADYEVLAILQKVELGAK